MTEMPAIALIPEEINEAKSLARTMNKAGVLAKAHRAAFPAQAAGHLWKAQRALFKRVQELKEPVDVIVGTGDKQQVVKAHDDKALCECVRALCAIIEHRRIVLRIPGPGRDTLLEQRTIEMLPADIVQAGESMSEAMPAQQQPANEPACPPDASPSPAPHKT